jgi:hypothetical protein
MQPHDPKVSPLPTARQPWASETKDEGSASLVPNLHAQPNQIKAIQRDAKDPQFLANLNRLGPVRVDHHMQTIRTVSFCFVSLLNGYDGTDHTRLNDLSPSVSVCFVGKVNQGSFVEELFESRERAEEEASAAAATPNTSSSSNDNNDRGSLRNRLHVSSFVKLLEERRYLDGKGAADSGSVRRVLTEKYGMDVEGLEGLERFVNVPSVREGEKSVRRYVSDTENGEQVAVREVSFNLFIYFPLLLGGGQGPEEGSCCC